MFEPEDVCSVRGGRGGMGNQGMSMCGGVCVSGGRRGKPDQGISVCVCVTSSDLKKLRHKRRPYQCSRDDTNRLCTSMSFRPAGKCKAFQSTPRFQSCSSPRKPDGFLLYSPSASVCYTCGFCGYRFNHSE